MLDSKEVMSGDYPYYRYCSVSWCRNNGRTNKPGLHYFRIPVDSRLAAWVAYTGREDLKTKAANMLNNNYKVCSDHFTDRDFMNAVSRNKLTRQAIPSVPPDTKVSGPKKAHSRSSNERLSTCQRTTKRRWKWQSEVPRSSSPNGGGILLIPDDNVLVIPDDDFLVIPIDDDGAATAPLSSRSADDQSCNSEDTQLCFEVQLSPSPDDDYNRVTPDDNSEDGAATAPLSATTSDEQFYTLEDISLYLE
ncbi:hypothetical protein MTO96_026430, partial [Rhipicephalus appendiculatus]